MKLLIFCIFISACSAFDFDCLKGPDFWCLNLANAEKCGRVTECFMGKTKESNLDFQNIFTCNKESGECCTLCNKIVAFVESELPKISPQDFNNILNAKVCERLHGDLEVVCKALVSQYGSVIYDTIKNDLSPGKVCGFIKMCKTESNLSFLKYFDKFTSDSGDVCTKCKEFFNFLEIMFSKITPDEFKLLLENLVCRQLPSEFQSMCDTLLGGYATQLYELIKTFLDGDRMCPLFHLCSSKPKAHVSGWTCQTCLDVVVVLKKDLVGVPGTDVAALIKNLGCSKLSIFARGICDDYVDNFIPKIINQIQSGLTPQQICNANKLCASHPFQTLILKSAKGIECDACRMAVGKFKQFISDPTRETEIKNFVKNRVCSIFPSERIQCQQLVDEYFNILLNFIISEIDVDTVCRAMNMCATRKVSSIKCEACELVMNEVIAVVTSNKSEQAVSKFLLTVVCPNLGFLSQDCNNYINTYLPAIFSLARSTLNSKVLCAELKLCDLISLKKISLIMQYQRSNPIKCEICQLMINETIFLLTNPQIQQTIENFLINEICSRMGSKKEECTNDITQYYSLVINLIVEFLKPSLCTKIGLCSAVNEPRSHHQPFYNIMKPKKTNHCQLCTKFYQYLQSISSRKLQTSDVLAVVGLCNQVNHQEKLQVILVI